MKKAIIAILLLCAIGIGVLLFPLPAGHHPDHYVPKIVSPFPSTLRHVKTLRLFEPTLGDGFCVAAYSISARDFDLLLKARPWASGFRNSRTKPAQYFASVWPGTPSEFESYHFTIDDTHDVDLAVSKDHTKIIFSMSNI